MSKKYVIHLNPAERLQLTEVLGAAATPVRCRRRARLLLDADAEGPDGGLNDQAVSRLRWVSVTTVARVRQLFVEGGVEAVLALPTATLPRSPLLQAQQVSRLRSLAASPPPAGSHRWSLRQLAEAMVARGYVGAISHETVRRRLRQGRVGERYPTT